MKIRCIVIDDEPIARKGMVEYISQIDFLELAGVFESAQKAYTVLNEQQIDLLFLDIQMPKISGVDFVKSLNDPPHIIFTTAYPDYALQGYELDAVDYLVKPIAFSRFVKAANKVKEILASRFTGYFFVKENGKFIRVIYEDVLYIEALQNYVSIHLANRKIVSYITLSVLEKQLPPTIFMRVHKSYIISLNRVASIEGNAVVIDSTAIPVSRKIKDQLAQRVLENKLLKR
jgi:DNA-binding LytR/AlgR family response regulator